MKSPALGAIRKFKNALKIFSRILFVFLFLLTQKTVLAQNGTTISASVDKYKILIGEPLSLTIKVHLPVDAPVSFIEIDSIPHFEIQGRPVFDTISTNNGTLVRGVYKLASFDSGHWVIPSFVLQPKIQTDTIPIDVVFSDFDPNQPYHDIKDIVDVRSREKKRWWPYAIAAAILALLLIYLLRKKKPVLVVKPAIAIDAYKEAMSELEKIKGIKLEPKQYYSRLIEIFRLYIYRKKKILSLQKTTDDLVLQLKDLGLTKDNFEKLSQSLRMSDFVKFAKYVPTESDDRKAWEDISNAIVQIEILEPKPNLQKG